MSAKFILKGMACLVILLSTVGCQSSNIKPYQDTYTKNFTAYLTQHSDKGIKARVDIFTLDKACQDHYQGTVHFEKKPTRIGIPGNRKMALSFHFLSSHWLQGKSSTIVNTLFTARSGYRYEAVLNYVDSTFEIDLFEIKESTKRRRRLELVSLNACH